MKGENAFKVRAYRLAALQVENLGSELSDLAAAGALRGVSGFGVAIAQKVEELVTTGRLGYLERLEAEVPSSLLEICALEGVGPRTANMLWKVAGIESLDALDAATRSGGLAGLPRMGARTVERIVVALERHRSREGARRRPREEVAPLAGELVGALRGLDSAARVEFAGSFRRGRADVGDLDVLVATERPGEVLAAFAALPAVERVLLRGDTKCSVHAAGGLQVDCRAVAPGQFGAAWQYFTGSQAHNIRLRGLALRAGLTLNEYGVFTVDGGERLGGETEEGVYALLGLRWIPPAEREGGAEVDAARLAAPQAAGPPSRFLSIDGHAARAEPVPLHPLGGH
ncbi:MAG TPA: nucleotidyltransferase domain-containing protein [Candidatus Dormibacteraeota bacterium]|nr:nucleotidyltransferase domain-containing protein [Candidatus Dormibacteraeota bacterium]